MICIHDWESWGEAVQVCQEVVQYRRCRICGRIVERTITTTTAAGARAINESLKQEAAE